MVKVSTEIDHEQIFTSGMIHRSCGEAARPMDHGTGTSTTSMYLSNMVPTQTPAKTIQTSVLRRTGTGARKGGSIKYSHRVAACVAPRARIRQRARSSMQRICDAAIGRVFPCRPHGRASISNFIYRALDPYVSTGIVMGTVPMTIPVDTYGSSAL